MSPSSIVTARHLSYRSAVYPSAVTPPGIMLGTGTYSIMRAAP
jgi:hypothetical protein